MPYETIQVDPVSPLIGAEISGVDISQPLGNQTFQEIHDALMEHQVIFFRDQGMDLDQHKAFGRLFGELHIHPTAKAPEGHPEIITIHADENSKVVAGMKWHSDVSCDAKPPQASILQLHELPDNGGDTLFSSLYAAYDTLSSKMKTYLDGLTALHSGEEPFAHLFKFQRQGDTQPWPEHHHPIVRKHADSGKPALFVDREFTKEIDDLPKEEGRALLQFLFNHVERVDFQCRFKWATNDIAIWDNRCVLHHAIWDYWPQERKGRRISVEGEQPLTWHLNDSGHDPVATRLTR